MAFPGIPFYILVNGLPCTGSVSTRKPEVLESKDHELLRPPFQRLAQGRIGGLKELFIK